MTNVSIGFFAAKYESRNDPFAISTGEGDHGGKSYGTYQMTKANVDKFVAQLPEGSPVKAALTDGRDFDTAWRKGLDTYDRTYTPQMYRSDFYTLQEEYIKKTHYLPLVNALDPITGFSATYSASVLQAVLFSRSVQLGVKLATSVCGDAWLNRKHSGLTEGVYLRERQWITEIYKECLREKDGVLVYFKSSPKLKDGLVKRFNKERDEALSLIMT